MTKYEKELTLKDLLEKVKIYNDKEEDLIKIEKAYNYAKDKHRGDIRKSGDTYISYLLETAYILAEIFASVETIVASLLREVSNRTDTDIEEIKELFGEDIASIIITVNKLNNIRLSTENDSLIEYYKKIVVGLAEDVKTIVIVLADVLANMRTLWALSPEKQKEKAKEAEEIFAPIAHHLGIHKIKSDIEDLSLRYLKPDVFYGIAEELNTTKKERDLAVRNMIQTVSELLEEHHINNYITGRSKSIYSIYKKLDKGKTFKDIYDFLAMRVLVNTKQECYQVLGIIHSKFKPMPGRFKDYIAVPKPNGYQSLHTTVFGNDGNLYEIQIRTYEMDEFAENGVASHWAYKEKKNLKEKGENLTEQKLQFFKTVIEMHENKLSSEELVNSFKEEIKSNNIYVYTPKGDIFELQKDSTPIDFAYRVHTQVGEMATGAVVNNRIVPLDYKLQDNDIVKIITDKNSVGPSREWLNFVKSTQTKAKIKSFFNKSERENYVNRGKERLEKTLRKTKHPISEFLNDDNLDKLLEETKLKDIEEIYYNIGKNILSPKTLVNYIYKDEKEEEKIVFSEFEKAKDSPISVEGIKNIKVNISSCCQPIPGDNIIGFITKTKGITVHRNDCKNVIDLDERLIEVKWSNKEKDKFRTSIIVYASDNEVLSKVINRANIQNINVDSMRTVNKDDSFTYILNLYVKDKVYLEGFLNDIRRLKGIIKVERKID